MSESLYGESGTQPAKAAPQSLMDQLIGIFTEPAKVFRRLRDTPNWMGAFLLVLLVSFAAGLVWAHKLDPLAHVEHNMRVLESLIGKPIPQAQIDKAMEQVHGQPYLGTALQFLVGLPIIFLIQSLLAWGFAAIGREASQPPATFKQAWSVISIQGLAMAPAFLLAIVVILTRSVGGNHLHHFTPTNLAFFTHPEAPLVRGLHTLMDPFYLWSFALLAYGMKHTLRARTGAIVGLLVFLAVFGLSFRFMGGMF